MSILKFEYRNPKQIQNNKSKIQNNFEHFPPKANQSLAGNILKDSHCYLLVVFRYRSRIRIMLYLEHLD